MIQDIKTALQIKPKNWELRVFGIILALILIFLAIRFNILYLSWTAGIPMMLAIIKPRLLTLPVLTLIVITAPIGWTLSRIALVISFYLGVTPVAIARRLLKHDTLHLKPENRNSYWEEVERNASHDKMHL